MSLQLRFASHSEIGLVRKNNQDSGYASPELLVVADGMGGAAAGDLASAVAIDSIRRLDHADGAAMLDELSTAMRVANDRIADLITDDFSLEGMGTTVTGALFDGRQLGLAHIGDSRAYLLRDGRLERLTHDHSWVQSLVDEGKINEAEASVHPHRSLLLKVLNGQPANDPDLTLVRLQAGDRLLFCSDGICGLVDDRDIEAALRMPDLQAALRELVEAALAEGGIDNITAIVADVTDGEGAGETAVLGAAAERKIPELGHTRHDDAHEDTVIRTRPPAGSSNTGADPTEDEARYNPQAPRRARGSRVLAVVVALAVLVGAGLGTGYAWTRTQYFVGAADQRVAIYQGLPDTVPGIRLSSLYEIQPLLLSALPAYYQSMIMAGIEVDSLASARQTVSELTATAKRCAQPTTPPRVVSPSPSATSRPPSPPISNRPGSITARPSTSASRPATSTPATSAPATSAPATPRLTPAPPPTSTVSTASPASTPSPAATPGAPTKPDC